MTNKSKGLVFLSPLSRSGAVPSHDAAHHERAVRGRQAQGGAFEEPPGERGPPGGGRSPTYHQRRRQHPPPREVHAGSGGPHHR